MAFSVTTVAANWTHQNLLSPANTWQYGVWQTQRPVNNSFYFQVWRQGQTFRTNTYPSDYLDLTQTGRWQLGERAQLITTSSKTSEHHLFLNDYQNSRSSATLRLDSPTDLEAGLQLWEFATFSFEFSITRLGSVSPEFDIPVLAVDVCGQQYSAVLGKEMSKKSKYHQVFLSNPGTCEDNPYITFYTLGSGTDELSHFVYLRQFSFAGLRLGTSSDINQVFAVNDAGAGNARQLTKKTYEQLCASFDGCYLQTDDDNFFGTLDEDGELANVGSYTLLLTSNKDHTVNQSLTIDEIAVESDGSLSLLVDTSTFTPETRQQALIMATAIQVQELFGDWDALTHAADTGISNYAGAPFVSTLNGWQTAHFTPALSQEDGYYFALRLRDYYGEYGPMSAIYYCHDFACAPTDIQDEHQILLTKLRFHDDLQTAELQLTLLDSNLDINNFTLGHHDVTWSLRDATRQGQTLTLTLDNVTREDCVLQLFDSQGQLIDQLQHTTITAPFSFVRNLDTKQWKAQYVRD